MTQRQRAIEIVKALRDKAYVHVTTDAEFADALLASEFCSDPVRELVKKLYDKWRGVPLITLGLGGKEIELLRKIVED